ncbi:TPR domain protein in aerotolerance operon [Vibrio variabilis]|uniref:TPR domain protein in aerotolerance operon n=1 Tax=Vibrio variabilis TaxID=990271 RepID=A0ABQ0JQH4_9VIBR|nr:TPR domain protein in aerotolerance operon [Vibrio variabilis]
MSQSVYAEDIKPSRLAQIRYKALDILSLFEQGQTGLVAYAGDAYTLSPLTTDAATLANAIQYLSPEIMPFQREGRSGR